MNCWEPTNLAELMEEALSLFRLRAEEKSIAIQENWTSDECAITIDPKRTLQILVNLLSIAVLFLLVQGHTAWLAERDVGGFFQSLASLPENIGRGTQLIGMQAFRVGFSVALIVTIVETVIMLVRLVIAGLQPDPNQGVYRIRKA